MSNSTNTSAISDINQYLTLASIIPIILVIGLLYFYRLKILHLYYKYRYQKKSYYYNWGKLAFNFIVLPEVIKTMKEGHHMIRYSPSRDQGQFGFEMKICTADLITNEEYQKPDVINWRKFYSAIAVVAHEYGFSAKIYDTHDIIVRSTWPESEPTYTRKIPSLYLDISWAKSTQELIGEIKP